MRNARMRDNILVELRTWSGDDLRTVAQYLVSRYYVEEFSAFVSGGRPESDISLLLKRQRSKVPAANGVELEFLAPVLRSALVAEAVGEIGVHQTPQLIIDNQMR